MNDNLLKIIEESRSLNPKIFSLSRMLILSSLLDLGQDGSTYRELKTVLDLEEGIFYSNIKALEEMGYIVSEEVIIENKTILSCHITREGEEAWLQTKNWLQKLLDC